MSYLFWAFLRVPGHFLNENFHFEGLFLTKINFCQSKSDPKLFREIQLFDFAFEYYYICYQKGWIYVVANFNFVFIHESYIFKK